MRRMYPSVTSLLLVGVVACNRDSALPNLTDPDVAGSSKQTALGPEIVTGPTREGYIRGPDGQPLFVTYVVHGGRGIYQGDIDLGPVERIPTTLSEPQNSFPRPQRGSVIDEGPYATYRWDGGFVPYVIDGSIQNPSRIEAALDSIRQRTGVLDFVPRTSQTAYVRYVAATECSSAVGRQGGEQLIRINETGCFVGNIIHETLHALGLWHEQSRCDRDNYVEIRWDRIVDAYEHNFGKQCTGSNDYFSYNESSIMHYGQFAFCITPCPGPTIVSLTGRQADMGQRDSLATVDAATLVEVNHFHISVYGATLIYSDGTYSWTAEPESRFEGPYVYWWKRSWDGYNWETLEGAETETLQLYVDHCRGQNGEPIPPWTEASFYLQAFAIGYPNGFLYHGSSYGGTWFEVRQVPDGCPGS